MPAVQLAVEHVSKAFGSGLLGRKRKPVLADISFTVKKGKSFGIMGESGTGKTTLGKILAGIENPSSGEVRFQGRDVFDMDSKSYTGFRRKVQMLFQDPEGSLNPQKTVGRALSEVLRLIRVPGEEWKKRIGDILETVGLTEEILVRFPSQLSGGQNQRIALARILLIEPELIVLDEPTSALDLSAQAQILHLLKSLQDQRSISYVFISHDREVIAFMCPTFGRIADGRLLPGTG